MMITGRVDFAFENCSHESNSYDECGERRNKETMKTNGIDCQHGGPKWSYSTSRMNLNEKIDIIERHSMERIYELRANGKVLTEREETGRSSNKLIRGGVERLHVWSRKRKALAVRHLVNRSSKQAKHRRLCITERSCVWNRGAASSPALSEVMMEDGTVSSIFSAPCSPCGSTCSLETLSATAAQRTCFPLEVLGWPGESLDSVSREKDLLLNGTLSSATIEDDTVLLCLRVRKSALLQILLNGD